ASYGEKAQCLAGLGRFQEALQFDERAMQEVQQLEELRQWRDASPTYQLDWRWIERYRQLTSFDAFWWLAHAGPFTDEEQRQWEQLLSQGEDQEAKKSLEALII